MKHNPIFWAYNMYGHKVIRNFEIENIEKNMTVQRYWVNADGLDNNNYMYYENFQLFDQFDSNGCEYERYGSIIEEGDLVVDIGANIGMFARRALERGCSKVICIEPTTKAFSCLIDNIPYDKSDFYKFAIGYEEGFGDIKVKYTTLGGSTMFKDNDTFDKIEKVSVYTINHLWEVGIFPDNIDFIKIDTEGGEIPIMSQITDENLLRIKKGSLEYHLQTGGSNEHYSEFLNRLSKLGYNHFTNHYNNGDRLLNFWKT